MKTCWNCKSFISCLRTGQVHVVDDMGLSCDFYEREDRLQKIEIKVIDGICYRRIIDDEGDG